MESQSCSLDLQYADQIAALLAPPSPESARAYYQDAIKATQCQGIKIKMDGEFGKGVYSSQNYEEGELILNDQILVATQHCSNKIDCLVCSYCFRYIGSIELQIGRKLYLNGLGLSSDCDVEGDCSLDSSVTKENHSCSSEYLELNNCQVPEGVVISLMNGDMLLPYSEMFPLPPVIPCLGGCKEEHYCSEACAKSDWETTHSLLCTGEKTEIRQREALVKFMEHANRTNDIFILAAKVIAQTILKYKKMRKSLAEQHVTCNGPSEKCTSEFSLLLEAWKPISLGYKKRWWDCIALPVDVDCSNEGAFRLEIRSLAFTSIQLLQDAIFDVECAVLFSLEIYGHIIGMFELNNLDLVVASPVEDYFLYIDDLPLSIKENVEKSTELFLNALGGDYSVCCQGTAFFPLQSCINHSCYPNAKAFKREQDRDGQAIILALRPIFEGEEITISYIDEDLPYEQRQELLADYGFTCSCCKCQEESPDAVTAKLLKKLD